MDRKRLIHQLFKDGKKAGFGDMEVYIQSSSKFDLKVFQEEIDNYNLSEEEGLSFRGLYNGKMGYSYTEKIDETSIEILIHEAIENAVVIDSDDEEVIFEGSKAYKEINNYNESLQKVATGEKIKFTKTLEREPFKLDERVVSVPHCIYGEESMHTLLVNTKGLDLENKSNIAYTYVSVMVKDGEDIKTSGKYLISNDFSRFDFNTLAKEAVEEAVSMLGARTISTDDYSVILRNDVAANILEAFTPIFSAENVQKDLSLLKGKLDTEVASKIVNIVDDPFLKDGVASSSFDGEGVATKDKRLIDQGILTTYLHNLKTAAKEDVTSTGNAYKASYKSPISIAPTNMYIEKGRSSLEEMTTNLDKGILIINVEGLHSGLNPVSGDFSLSAYGYEIEKGKVKRPVNQITIAGNFFEMLKAIDQIGSDLKFTLPSGHGYIGSPSLRIKAISVAGE